MYEFDEEFLGKLAALRAAGVEPWPSGLTVTHTAGELRAVHGALPPDSRVEDTDVRVAGRNTQGVRLVNLQGSEESGNLLPDMVGGVTRVVSEDDDGGTEVNGETPEA